MKRESQYKLKVVLTQFYDTYKLWRAFPKLRGDGSQLGMRKLCNVLFNTMIPSGCLQKRKLLRWERSKALQYSIPSIEKACIRLFYKAFPHTRKYRLHEAKRITSDDVFKRDLASIKKYRKPKRMRTDYINGNRLNETISHVNSELYQGRLTMNSFEEACKNLPQNTSSCYPLYQKKSSFEAIRDANIKLQKIIKADSISDRLKIMNSQLVTVFHRFTTKLRGVKDENIVDHKIRQVFGVPFPITIIENMLFGKAIKALANLGIDSFFSYSLRRPEISEQVKIIRQEAIRRRGVILCGDISQIDANTTPYQIYLTLCFLSSHYRYDRIWSEILYAYSVWITYTPILWSARTISWTLGGNISGSVLTSIMNSYNVLIALDYSYKTIYGRHLTKDDVKVLGDDFILVLDREEDKQRIIECVKLFNLDIHPEKSRIVKSDSMILYLGFYWNTDGQPYNDEKWYIARICFPERYVYEEGFARIIQRSASILFQTANGKYLFDKLITFQVPSFRKILNDGIDPMIKHLDKQGSEYYIRIPYSKLRLFGWRSF